MVKSTSVLQLVSALLAVGVLNPQLTQTQFEHLSFIFSGSVAQAESLQVGLPALDQQLIDAVRSGDIRGVEIAQPNKVTIGWSDCW